MRAVPGTGPCVRLDHREPGGLDDVAQCAGLLRDHGLTARQWLLLAVLTHEFTERRASLTELARVYGISRQNVRPLVTQISERGYVRLPKDEHDQRTVVVEPAARTAELNTPQAVSAQQTSLAAMFAPLSDG